MLQYFRGRFPEAYKSLRLGSVREVAGDDISISTLWRAVKGHSAPSAEVMEHVAGVADIDPSYFHEYRVLGLRELVEMSPDRSASLWYELIEDRDDGD